MVDLTMVESVDDSNNVYGWNQHKDVDLETQISQLKQLLEIATDCMYDNEYQNEDWILRYEEKQKEF